MSLAQGKGAHHGLIHPGDSPIKEGPTESPDTFPKCLSPAFTVILLNVNLGMKNRQSN